MPWIYLLIAAAFEIGWAIGLKYTQGLTKLWPTVFTVLAMIASFVFLALAVRTIPIGTGYAIWTGIGAVGTAIFGIIFLDESSNRPRLICIALIVVGLVGLKLTSPTAMVEPVIDEGTR
ncbi:MAG: quaternary ammonium compound efflux SMR transporter SugE [Planctomycetota bacterium]|nr:quaternary ammonium compound efflux SMR transporter SugE [Planctomycetaceae bacterium]MDQ3329100.1 quaternary ammonium compound efflux SMR transporter SugE [Planctomycetota bacterium]